MEEKGQQNNWDYLFVALMMIGVALFAVFFLFHQSLRLDEAQSLWQTGHSVKDVFTIVAEDVHVPLYHLILHFWQLFLGNGVATSRVLSLIFFIATIPAVYVLGKTINGRKVALFSALLVTISPFLNWYGSEIRMYSLLTFLTVLNQYFFIKLFIKKKDGANWWGYGITAFLGLFTHYYFVFNLLTQAVFFFFNRKLFKQGTLKRLGIIALIFLIFYAGWFYLVFNLKGISNSAPLLAKPTISNVFNTFSQFIFGFQDDHLNTLIVALWPLVSLLAFFTLAKNVKIKPVIYYLFLSFTFPILIAFGVSVLLIPLYLTRYLILIVPSLYLFFVWLLSTYSARLNRIFRVILVCAMLITLFNQVASASTPVKENYQEASNYLTLNATPQDAIVVSAPFTIYPFEYYYRGPVQVDTLPLWNRYQVGPIPAFSLTSLPNQVEQIANGHEIVWVLLSYDQGYESDIKNYFDTHYQRLQAINFSQDLNLYAYKVHYP